ncbi:hypothetical protein PSHT_01280 [Puccinia striiformis]|uniref:Uncharacterized protein n=1 Tax=Puccinia striiformis TaxID=27350 RepID=A0A2S4WKT0_9BASI|nr:hypothetical protein PSHT_01280 [Puccinia striiformis]
MLSTSMVAESRVRRSPTNCVANVVPSPRFPDNLLIKLLGAWEPLKKSFQFCAKSGLAYHILPSHNIRHALSDPIHTLLHVSFMFTACASFSKTSIGVQFRKKLTFPGSAEIDKLGGITWNISCKDAEINNIGATREQARSELHELNTRDVQKLKQVARRSPLANSTRPASMACLLKCAD